MSRLKISTLCSLVFPTDNERIRQTTTTITSPYTWADIEDVVRSYFNRLDIAPDFTPVESTSIISPAPAPSAAATADLVQIVQDAGFYGSIASYAHGIIKDWPSSSRAEAAAVYAALTVTPPNSTIKIYTDSQTAIDRLRLYAFSSYTNSRIYYKTTNFELWAIIERLILSKCLNVIPIKVKAHSNNYWNDFADSLANTAYTSSSAILISGMDQASPYDFILVYDDVICESNSRRLFKQYY
ncbi:unnamed protein product [Rhizophagus irregularis]|nr:unnamed protein product [Rhizophagus irregularis]